MVGIKMNAPGDRIDAITAVLPSQKAPTVSHLYKSDWVSIESILSEKDVRKIVPELLKLGGQLLSGRRIKEVAGSPVETTAKRIRRAVQCVGTRLNSDVHDGAGPPAELGFRILLEIEFLDRVDG